MIILFIVITTLLYIFLSYMRPAYGTVFTTHQGEYVDLATIILVDADTRREVSRVVSDMRGRYAFFVQPGKYRILVERTHFSPVYGFSFFNLIYGMPYRGGVIVRTSESVIGLPIALEQNAPDWNHTNKIRLKKQIAGYQVVLRIVTALITVSSIVVTLILTIQARSLQMLGISVALIVWLLLFLYDHTPVVGRVFSRAIAFNKSFIEVIGFGGTVIKKIPVTQSGHYWSLVPPGSYDLLLYRINDIDKSELVAHFKRIYCPRGVLNKSLHV